MSGSVKDVHIKNTIIYDSGIFFFFFFFFFFFLMELCSCLRGVYSCLVLFNVLLQFVFVGSICIYLRYYNLLVCILELVYLLFELFFSIYQNNLYLAELWPLILDKSQCLCFVDLLASVYNLNFTNLGDNLNLYHF